MPQRSEALYSVGRGRISDPGGAHAAQDGLLCPDDPGVPEEKRRDYEILW